MGLDGWTLEQSLSGSLKNNVLVHKITGFYTSIVSPYTLNIDASKYKNISFTMKNSTSDSSAQVFWRRDTDTKFNESRSAIFTTVANDTGFTEYTVDLSKDSARGGSIMQLRFDPGNSVSSGAVELQRIKLLGEITSVKTEETSNIPKAYSLS
jgi:hypothetical protein